VATRRATARLLIDTVQSMQSLSGCEQSIESQ